MAENITKETNVRVAAFLDVDEGVLEQLIDKSVKLMRKRYNVK